MRLVEPGASRKSLFKKVERKTLLYTLWNSVKTEKINHHGAIVPEIEMQKMGV